MSGVEFSTIETAIEYFKRGEYVVVMDDEDRENEGERNQIRANVCRSFVAAVPQLLLCMRLCRIKTHLCGSAAKIKTEQRCILTHHQQSCIKMHLFLNLYFCGRAAKTDFDAAEPHTCTEAVAAQPQQKIAEKICGCAARQRQNKDAI